MRKAALFFLFSSCFTHFALYAQQTTMSLNFYGGNVFRDKVNFGDFYGYIEDGIQYGVAFESGIRHYSSFEIKYLRLDTYAPVYFSNTGAPANKNTDAIDINYILIGGNNYLPSHSSLAPYGGGDIGLALVESENGGSSNARFAWEARLGLKINASGAIAFKIQAQLQGILQGAGGGMYVGAARDVLGVSSYANILQFGFTGALVLKFK